MSANTLQISPATESLVEDTVEELDDNASATVQQALEHMHTADSLITQAGGYGDISVISHLSALHHEQRAANLLQLVSLAGNAPRFA